MADLGIKISLGPDVKDAKEKDIAFSSNRNLLKTNKVGVTTVATVFAHRLPYIPIFFSSRQSNANQGSIIGDDINTTCDTANFNPGALTKYFLFYQQGS